MPWDATLTQRFIRPLIDNLTSVLQAGETAVHTEVNGGPMAPYQVWRRSRWINTKFPACSVIPRRTRTIKGEGGPWVEETHGIEILIEDVGANPDDLADSVMKRVQAAHVIIERAPLTSLFAGYVVDKTHKPHWDIDHDYAQFFIEKSSYKQNGSLIVTFTGLLEKT